MSNYITIGKRFVPPEHIALVEPYDPAANPGFQTKRDSRARVVLLNRDSLLSEETPWAFADAHGFGMLGEEGVFEVRASNLE